MIASSLASSGGLPIPASRLEASEVAAYRRDGFLVCDSVLGLDEVAALRNALDECGLAAEIAGARAQVMKLELTRLHPAFLALARDPRIVGRVVPLIGDDVALEHSKLSAQPHGPGGGVRWHQDLAFYPHSNNDVLAVMVMLDDATPENGCMRMIPGSHRLGALDHAAADGCFLGACAEQAPWDERGDAAWITPRAGGISIHHGLTLHASGENRDRSPRRGLVLNYRAADAYQLGDMAFADTGLLVSGRYRETARLEAMTVRLPRFAAAWGRGAHGSAWNQLGDFAAASNAAAGLRPTGALE